MELGKKTIAVFTLAILISGVVGYSIRGYTVEQHRDPKITANLVLFFEKMGGSYYGGGGNTITNIGEGAARNHFGFNNMSWAAYQHCTSISIGNSTIGASDTKLDTEALGTIGQNRTDYLTAVTWQNGTDYAYNVSNKFQFTGAIRVGEAGLHWSNVSNSDNNMFAASAFTDTTFASGDNLTITWVITFDGN